jgi:hypothetical protein
VSLQKNRRKFKLRKLPPSREPRGAFLGAEARAGRPEAGNAKKAVYKFGAGRSPGRAYLSQPPIKAIRLAMMAASAVIK